MTININAIPIMDDGKFPAPFNPERISSVRFDFQLANTLEAIKNCEFKWLIMNHSQSDILSLA